MTLEFTPKTWRCPRTKHALNAHTAFLRLLANSALLKGTLRITWPPFYSWSKGTSEVLNCPKSTEWFSGSVRNRNLHLPPRPERYLLNRIPTLWSFLNLFVYLHVRNGTQVTKWAPALIGVISVPHWAWAGFLSRRGPAWSPLLSGQDHLLEHGLALEPIASFCLGM